MFRDFRDALERFDGSTRSDYDIRHVCVTDWSTVDEVGVAEDPAAAALAVAEYFVKVFNARDMERNREVLNYPSVLLVRGQFFSWDTPEDYSIPFDQLTESQGWHHSTLDSAEVVQSGPDKVHLLVRFSRYDADDVKYVTHHGLWVITCVDGHWGIQCRSNFAP